MNIDRIISGWPLWLACGLIVVFVLVQAFIFAGRARKAAVKIGLSKEQIRQASTTSAITAIGPSIVILSGMISLLVSLGAPLSWARLSVVGGVMYESVAAGIGTGRAGVTLGTDTLTPQAFTLAVWTMTLCSIGWILFATFFAGRMEKVTRKATLENAKSYVTISGCALVGVFAAFSAENLVQLNKSALACIFGAVIMFIMNRLTCRLHLDRLKQWNLSIAIAGAVVLTVLI